MDPKVEIGQYREVNKGSLKAYFSMVIYPEGQKILDCQYFVKGVQRWFSFPQKKVEKNGNVEYIPLVSYLNKEHLEKLKASVIEALTLQESHGQSNAHQNVQDAFQSDASPLPF